MAVPATVTPPVEMCAVSTWLAEEGDATVTVDPAPGTTRPARRSCTVSGVAEPT
jgi:hypothetical protein